MKTSTIVAILVAIVVVGGGWWYFSQGSAASAGQAGINGSPDQGNQGGADTGTPQQPQGDGTGVSQNLILGQSSSASAGTFLTAYNGMTLYTYSKDAPGVSNCTGACANNWPPYSVLAADTINVPANLKGSVNTITRADGTLQITYNGKPLYFYIQDSKPGDTTGQGVGGVWYVATP